MANNLENLWCGCERGGQLCPEGERLSKGDLFEDHLRVAEVCLGQRRISSFQDIPTFPSNHYEVDVEWGGLERTIQKHIEEDALDLLPRFQRGHVWTEAQQVAYVEAMLQNSEVSRLIIFNHTTWNTLSGNREKSMTIVDGLQRLEAVRKFMRGELRVFGLLVGEFSGRLRMTNARFQMRVLSLPTEAAVIRLYLALNGGGTPHSAEELDRVRALLRS